MHTRETPVASTAPVGGSGDARRQLCPCVNATAMHVGGCLFAAAMIGGAVYGFVGAIVGAAFGVFVGTAAAMSKNS